MHFIFFAFQVLRQAQKGYLVRQPISSEMNNAKSHEIPGLLQQPTIKTRTNKPVHLIASASSSSSSSRFCASSDKKAKEIGTRMFNSKERCLTTVAPRTSRHGVKRSAVVHEALSEPSGMESVPHSPNVCNNVSSNEASQKSPCKVDDVQIHEISSSSESEAYTTTHLMQIQKDLCAQSAIKKTKRTLDSTFKHETSTDQYHPPQTRHTTSSNTGALNGSKRSTSNLETLNPKRLHSKLTSTLQSHACTRGSNRPIKSELILLQGTLSKHLNQHARKSRPKSRSVESLLQVSHLIT